MDLLNQVNIEQEEDDEKKKVLIRKVEKQQNSKESRNENTSHSDICIKQEFDDDDVDEHKEVKNISQQYSIQGCTKVKKEEEEGGECKVEWDGDECDCEECRVKREVKIEFNQTNTIEDISYRGVNRCQGPSEAMKGAPEQFKRVNNEDDLAGNGNGLAMDDRDCEDNDELYEEGDQSEDGQEKDDGQTGNDDDEDVETKIDDEEYEMEVDGEVMSDDDEETEVEDEHSERESENKVSNELPQNVLTQRPRDSTVIQQEERNANNAIGEKIAIATKCTTNPIQPNRHLQCSHCHKSFDHKSHLQQHLRMHTGERPYQCDLCDKRFSLFGNLNRHKLTHQNIKHFRCDQCEKHFTLKHHLDSHLLTHSGGRPFTCRHCAKSFKTSDNRTKHEQAIHLHVKPYRCKQCGHTATERSTIIKHIRVVHFGLPPAIKQQRALNMIDHRDPRKLVEKV